MRRKFWSKEKADDDSNERTTTVVTASSSTNASVLRLLVLAFFFSFFLFRFFFHCFQQNICCDQQLNELKTRPVKFELVKEAKESKDGEEAIRIREEDEKNGEKKEMN